MTTECRPHAHVSATAWCLTPFRIKRYNFKTGKNEWVVLRNTDRAVGVECGRGMAFVLNPLYEKILAVDTTTGTIKFVVDAKGCVRRLLLLLTRPWKK